MNREAELSLPQIEAPLVVASDDTLEGYGCVVSDPATIEIEIVTWPAQGWRPVDEGTGNEGGTTEGIFEFWWEGDVLHGRNNAVGDQYVLGVGENNRTAISIGHANYHPDGGQLFMPLGGEPFVIPLAMPSDDLSLEDFVAFYSDGRYGVYIHPGVWHEAVFSANERSSFFDKQGKVHARVSAHFESEFGTRLWFPLQPLDAQS